MAHDHSNLGAWIARLREEDTSLTEKAAVDAIDAEALDNAVGFAAEHARLTNREIPLVHLARRNEPTA